MKKIELKKLTLSNWRGQNRVVEFNKDAITIKGKNGKGKTSVMSAWYWLLSGYTDTVLPKNSNLFDDTKPLSKDTPKAIVEAIVCIDGNEWAIKKTACASFKLNKSTGEWEKQTSDKYIYEIDDIEMSATDYNNWMVANICPIEMLTYCLDGSFFGVLSMEDKKAARKVLEAISGEIRREDFNGDYSLLEPWFKKGYETVEIEASTKTKQRNLNKRLIEIPAIIDGKEKFVSELQSQNFDEIERQMKQCKEEISELDKMLALNSACENKVKEERIKIQNQIDNLEVERAVKHRNYRNKYENDLNSLMNEINDIHFENARNEKFNFDLLLQRNELKEKLNKKKELLESLKAERKRLIAERDALKDEVFTDDICPVCHRGLPPIELEEAREKFNKKKALNLSNIVLQGKMNANGIKEIEAEIERIESVTSSDLGLKEIKDTKELEEKIEEFKKSYISFEDTDDYKEYNLKIASLEETMPSYNESDNKDLLQTKEGLLSMFEELSGKLGAKRLMEDALNDIEELKKERRALGIELTELESIIQKCKEYNEERANIVSDKVNKDLSRCYIQMWERQKNGELVPSCSIVSSDGVRLSTINHSEKVLIESEIQRLFCKKHDIQLPIFFDEASCFDTEHTPKSEGWQIVLLKASDDPYLVVE